MAGPGSLPPSTHSTPSNRGSRIPTVDIATEALYERINSIRSTTSTLLKDTKWPRESNDTAQNLLQIVDTIPDLPTEVHPLKDDAEQWVQAMEVVHTKVKKASEKYGMRERGFRDGIKHYMSSLHASKCTDILRNCREDIDKVSTELRGCLDSAKVIDPTPSGSRGGSEVPAGPQAQPNVSLVKSESRVESLEPPLGSQANPENPTSNRAPAPDASANIPQGQKIPNPIRAGVLTVAKKTFQTVETVSGAIPCVGDFVGVAAKTMDKNEDVSKELTHHTSKLSTYLEHFKKKTDAENGDELVTYLDNIHKELEEVREKVKQWSSSGRLRKAFLSSDHAEELKGYQDTIQTALEEMHLLVSLKTSDVVLELRNAELRAERRRLLACLGDGSYGARGNSIEDVVCLSGTRVGILERIDEWIKDTSDSAERVLWIRGMAGRGKSTIASTVAHNWASKGSCAIFHFRRGQNALDGQFVCALSRQLGKGLVPEVKTAILDCVKVNEDIAKERLDQQFKTLFVGPLERLQDHAHPIVIIVDALDECKNVTDAVRFVRLIDRHSSFLPTNVKFLLTCRPEAPLLVALEPRKWHAEDLDSIPHVTEDITRFVQNACAQIREDHALSNTWPSSTDLEAIVEMSQGVFQWARTALTYISDRSPEHRLQELLQRSSTWSGLDDLYHQILSKAFDEVETNSLRRELLSWVLGTLVVAPYPVSLEVIAFLHADHAIFREQNNIIEFLRKDILADLNSLVRLSTSPSEPVRLMHTSIRDLLIARGRCGHQRYSIDATEDHRRLAGITLHIMGRSLKQNICNLPHILMANSEIQHLVDDHVSKGLRYCCRSWSIHLTAGVTGSKMTEEATSFILEKFRVFSKEKLLVWLEVMSLIGAMTEAGLVAKQVDEWLLEWPGEMSDGLIISLWNDIRRFIAAFIEPISFGALHIYASALPQCPVETQLWAKYVDQATTRILLGKRQLHWRKNIWTSSVGSRVGVIAFSPDGSIIASGSSARTVHMWDAQTGAPLGPLTGHNESINSIAFSPNGKVLASGSGDKTVRLWHAQTGAPLCGPLAGHNDSIHSVAFSPDSKTLASGSHDKTVRLWDAQTGAPIGDPLTGHSGAIRSVFFASDSKVLASLSNDKTVQLWNAQTGAPLSDPLTGRINCMAISPDGRVLASGSNGGTVRLWDARTGAPLGDPLSGHRSSISSVAFSPDGKVMASASASGEHVIRLWDAETGVSLGGPLTGHSSSIQEVVFSPDSKVLASASCDYTVRFWDAQTGAPLGNTLTDHNGWINSIAFSPDGKFLASGSSDNTVRLWDSQIEAPLGDLQTGPGSENSNFSSPADQVLTSGSYDETVRLWDAQSGKPLGDPPSVHNSHIESVVFSPNGKVLASCSEDETVRLWDAQTGAPLGNPLPGRYRDNHIIFSPDSKVLASWLDGKMVQLWNAQTGAPLGGPLPGHNNSISSVAFSPDSKILAFGAHDKTVRLWDAQTGAPIGDPLTGHSGAIRSVFFASDSKVLASLSDDKTARLWNSQSGAPLGDPLTCNISYSCSFVFSPNGKVVIIRSNTKTFQLYDAQTGSPLGDPLSGHNGWISSVAFSSDGKILASGSYDTTIRLWDGQTGAPLADPLTGHNGPINSVAFSPDGKVLASGSDCGTVRLWDAQTRAPLGNIPTSHSSISSVDFSPDGKVLAAEPSAASTVLLWDSQTRVPLGDPRLTCHSHGLAVSLGDPLPRGFPIKLASKDIQVQSDWLIWHSKRLMWLPAYYWGHRPRATMFPFQRLAVKSDKVLSILDVSRSLNL